MPSPLDLRKASNRAAKSKSIDLGKPLGPYDTNTVRDRVRQWQAQGGGVITADDIYVEVEEEETVEVKKKRPADEPTPKKTTPKKETPIKPKHKVPDLGASSTPTRRDGRRKEQEQEEELHDRRHRSASAPRRRIVSDKHWRQNRSPPPSTAPSTPELLSRARRIIPDDGIRVRPIPDQPPERKRSEERYGRETRKSKPRKDDDGIRVYSTPPELRHKPAEEDTRTIRSSSYTSDSDRDRSSSFSDGSPKQKKSRGGGRGVRFGSEKEAEVPRRHSPTKEKRSERQASGRKARDSRNVTPLKPRGTILDHALEHSRKLFSRPEPVVIPVPRIPTIEEWLDETPDPFVEGQFSVDRRVPLSPKPVKSSPEVVKPRKERKPYPTPADPNKIWDVLQSHDGDREERTSNAQDMFMADRSQVSNNSPHYDSRGAARSPEIGDDESHHGFFSSLKRRGARKASSPEKKSPRNDLQQYMEATSEYGSSQTSPPREAVRSPSSKKPSDRKLSSRRSPLQDIDENVQETVDSAVFRKHSLRDDVDRIASSLPLNVPRMSPAMKHSSRASKDPSEPTSLKRRGTTKHADLMSMLSVSKPAAKSIMSSRSIRTNRSRLAIATVKDIMAELASDETKYMRELNTLVDGVIPVLLTSVLSKAELSVTADLFRPGGAFSEDTSFTKPIIDMGVALERLKTLHKRIPKADLNAFLTWTHGAQKMYKEYIRVWRLGFQDVIVNLAPAEGPSSSADGASKEGLENAANHMPQNDAGDIVDSSGGRVDVAYLLKRPLVRLKYLSKTLTGLNIIRPSVECEALSIKFQELVEAARNRTNEEQARLEDEAAASIDPTRARDIRTLAPLAGVTLAKNRRVRARDCFNLNLRHSNGQMMECRVELILRDDPPGAGFDSDVLVCEVDVTGKWLLFPPIQWHNISARTGDAEGEIVVMIRGVERQSLEWDELFSLTTDDEHAGPDWVQMIGLTPVPPQLPDRSFSMSAIGSAPSALILSNLSDPMSIGVPIGERILSQPEKNLKHSNLPPAEDREGALPCIQQNTTRRENPREHHKRDSNHERAPRSLNDALRRAGKTRPQVHESLSNCGYQSSNGDKAPDPKHEIFAHQTTPIREFDETVHSSPHLLPESLTSPTASDISEQSEEMCFRPKDAQKRNKRFSAFMSKFRNKDDSKQASPPSQFGGPVAEGLVQEKHGHDDSEPPPPPPPPHRVVTPVQLNTAVAKSDSSSPNVRSTTTARNSSPLKHQYEPSAASSESASDSEVPMLDHGETTSPSDSSDDDLEEDDQLTPLIHLDALPRPKGASRARTEYSDGPESLTPSQSASQAPHESETPEPPKWPRKFVGMVMFFNEFSGEHPLLYPDEVSIVVTPGLIEAYKMSAAHSKADIWNVGTSTYRASIDHDTPILALELTPMVAIQRGTARDVSIRSPPTIDSDIRKIMGDNFCNTVKTFTFRSRSPEECIPLHIAVHEAKEQNPTWIALQNARKRPSYENAGPRPELAPNSRRSLFGNLFGGQSYRSKRNAKQSESVAQTENSTETKSSTFSALQHFVAKTRFSLSRSTVTKKRGGSRPNSVYTSSDQGSGSGTTTPGVLLGADGKAVGAPIGIRDLPITLHQRTGRAKDWTNMGKGKLTIVSPHPDSFPTLLNPDVPSITVTRPSFSNDGNSEKGASSVDGSSARLSRHRPGTRDENLRRVIVVNSKTGQTMLDLTAMENSFERIHTRGVSMCVWEESVDGKVLDQGGVLAGRSKYYMFEMDTSKEAAYTFSHLGKSRA